MGCGQADLIDCRAARVELSAPACRISRQDKLDDVDQNGSMRSLLVLASAAIAIGLAAPAVADPGDNSNTTVPPDPAADARFVDSLSKAGMTFRDGSAAVAAGRLACDLMNSGTSEQDVVSKLSMLNPGLNSGGAMKFAALASSAYCPDYLTRSSAQDKSKSQGPFGGMGR